MTTATAQQDKADVPVFHLTEDEHEHSGGSTMLGFWMYLMSDCLVFAVLFATYGVLGRSYAAGPSGADLFDLKLVAVNTTMLLFSSITYGFAMLAMDKGRQAAVQGWLLVTGLFGQLRALQRVLGLADGFAAVVGGAMVGEQVLDGGQGEHGMPSWTGTVSDDIAPW